MAPVTGHGANAIEPDHSGVDVGHGPGHDRSVTLSADQHVHGGIIEDVATVDVERGQRWWCPEGRTGGQFELGQLVGGARLGHDQRLGSRVWVIRSLTDWLARRSGVPPAAGPQPQAHSVELQRTEALAGRLETAIRIVEVVLQLVERGPALGP